MRSVREKKALADRLIAQNRIMSKMGDFLDSFKEKQWQHVMERLEIRLKQLQAHLESQYMDMDADQLKAMVGRIVEVKNFMHMPEDTKARLERLAEESRRIRQEMQRQKNKEGL